MKINLIVKHLRIFFIKNQNIAFLIDEFMKFILKKRKKVQLIIFV